MILIPEGILDVHNIDLVDDEAAEEPSEQVN